MRKYSDPVYISTVDDFDVIATHFSEDSCTTETSTETIDFSDVGDYIEATMNATYDAFLTLISSSGKSLSDRGWRGASIEKSKANP